MIERDLLGSESRRSYFSPKDRVALTGGWNDMAAFPCNINVKRMRRKRFTDRRHVGKNLILFSGWSIHIEAYVVFQTSTFYCAIEINKRVIRIPFKIPSVWGQYSNGLYEKAICFSVTFKIPFFYGYENELFFCLADPNKFTRGAVVRFRTLSL